MKPPLPSQKECSQHGHGGQLDPSTRDQNGQSALQRTENPAPGVSLGFVGEVHALKSLDDRESVELALPIDHDLLAKRQIDPTSLRLFRWASDQKTFRMIPGDFPEPKQSFVSGKITEPGLYTLIGLPSNLWTALTVDLLGENEGELQSADLDKSIKQMIHACTKHRSDIGNTMDRDRPCHHPEPPPFPDEDICQICHDLVLPDGRLAELDILKDPNRPPSSLLVSFDSWLTANPALANTIVWHRPRPHHGAPEAYPNWWRSQKEELARAFWRAFSGFSFGLPVTPPIDLLTDTSGINIYGEALDRDLAWNYYIAYVAQSLALEFAGRVPWSLLDYTNDELRMLLDSHSLFEYTDPYDHNWSHGYIISNFINQYSYGAVTPSDPVETYQWLRNNISFGATALETIIELLQWCHLNLIHSFGGFNIPTHQAHWQYEGWPPVMRVLEGTERSIPPRPSEFAHWTAGCWGTTGLLRALLRTINIPVALVPCCGHALPHFVHENRYLSHGDDLYNAMMDGLPIDQLLIDQTQFESWFNGSTHGPIACNNIGRQPFDLAIEHLPLPLLQLHCDDVANGRSHADSQIAERFAHLYDLQSLEVMQLWERMEEKLDDLGGCVSLPLS